MKTKTNLLSSFLIALLAGFIYYQFGGIQEIKKIPDIAYRIISRTVNSDDSDALIALDKTESIQSNSQSRNESNMNENIHPIVENNDNHFLFIEPDNVDINPAKLTQILEKKEFKNQMKRKFDFDYTFPEKNEFREKILKEIEEKMKNNNFDIQIDKENLYANLNDLSPLPDTLRNKIRIHGLDSLNINLDRMMSGINKMLDNLNQKLRERGFTDSLKSFNSEEFEFDMQEFEEDMKEFKNDMQRFNFDMKDFKENMKEFKEQMKKLKEEMKDLNKEQIRKFKIQIDTVNS